MQQLKPNYKIQHKNVESQRWSKRYRVFIKYCVFSELSKIFWTLFSLGVSVCTHNRQVKNQRYRRTGRVQKNHNILRKKHNI